MPKVLITPILQNPPGDKKRLRKIAGFFTCLVENRGVGVTTTLGLGEIFCYKGCYLHSGHYRGREFPCVVGISVSRVFRVILHIDSAIPYY